MSVIPGDWSVRDASLPQFQVGQAQYVHSFDAAGDEYVVAKVFSAADGDYESTARLISAAPDLLAACEELLIYLGDWDDMDNDTCAAARKAIAKAKGENTDASA